MSGYLEEYGTGEEKRENLIRNSILIAAAAVVVGAFAIYLFRPYHQIGFTKQFLDRVRAKDYPGAYAAWGCTSSRLCKDYPYSKFLEDWGPQSLAASGNSILRITDSESCGTGVILNVEVSAGNEQKLFVDKPADLLSFSPVQVCPGKSSWAIMMHRTLGRMRRILF